MRIAGGSTRAGARGPAPSPAARRADEPAAFVRAARAATASAAGAASPAERRPPTRRPSARPHERVPRACRAPRAGRPASSIARRSRPIGQAAVSSPLSSRTPYVARASSSSRSHSSWSASGTRARRAASSALVDGGRRAQAHGWRREAGQFARGAVVEVVAGDEPPAGERAVARRRGRRSGEEPSDVARGSMPQSAARAKKQPMGRRSRAVEPEVLADSHVGVGAGGPRQVRVECRGRRARAGSTASNAALSRFHRTARPRTSAASSASHGRSTTAVAAPRRPGGERPANGADREPRAAARAARGWSGGPTSESTRRTRGR